MSREREHRREGAQEGGGTGGREHMREGAQEEGSIEWREHKRKGADAHRTPPSTSG